MRTGAGPSNAARADGQSSMGGYRADTSRAGVCANAHMAAPRACFQLRLRASAWLMRAAGAGAGTVAMARARCSSARLAATGSPCDLMPHEQSLLRSCSHFHTVAEAHSPRRACWSLAMVHMEHIDAPCCWHWALPCIYLLPSLALWVPTDTETWPVRAWGLTRSDLSPAHTQKCQGCSQVQRPCQTRDASLCVWELPYPSSWSHSGSP